MDSEKAANLMLGQSTNLIDGYKPTTFFDEAPFTPSVQPALFEKKAVVKNPNYEAVWSWPVISLHPNAEHLLNSLMQIKLRPCSFEDKPCEGGEIPDWPTGALVLAGLTDEERTTALKKLSKEIGLDLTTPDWSYALVCRSRLLGSAVHPCCQTGLFRHVDPDNTLRPETLQALKRLQKLSKDTPDVNKDGAEGYLHFYNTFGTHFISCVHFGDYLFQVSGVIMMQ